MEGTTQLAWQDALQNKQRHDSAQIFMITSDSVTVATEVPVFFFQESFDISKESSGFTSRSQMTQRSPDTLTFFKCETVQSTSLTTSIFPMFGGSSCRR